MQVECVEAKVIQNDYLKAVCKVKFPDWGITINDIKFFKKDDGHWVKLPDREYKTDEGKKYFPIITFCDEDKKKELQKLMVEAISKKLLTDGKEWQVRKDMANDSRHQPFERFETGEVPF